MNLSFKDNGFQNEIAFLPGHSSNGKSVLIYCNEIILNQFKRKKQNNKTNPAEMLPYQHESFP